MKICFVLGTRPEIVKLSPLIRFCENEGVEYFVIHTGQHYSYTMDQIFFKDLDLKPARYNLEIGSGNHGAQTGKMLERIEEVLLTERPGVVLVQGDTNSVLAGALAAVKLHIKVGHVEAGLRSYFREMPEEINRVITDHISEFNFVPTANAKKNILAEGIPESKIFVTGNPIVDAVLQNVSLCRSKSNILEDLVLQEGKYILVTAHRQENVDHEEKMKGIIDGLSLVQKHLKLPIIYPIHPRSKKMLERFSIKVPAEIRMIEPLGFIDFLFLESKAGLVITDSGGLQEECCILKVPCVTLRENTERPETVEVGANVLAGTDAERILSSAEYMISRSRDWVNPFGDGKSAARMIRILREHEDN